MNADRCPTCGALIPTQPDLSSLTAPERDLLRAARMRKDEAPYRIADLARWSGWDYGRAWRAVGRLRLRGYVGQDERKRLWPRWERLPIPERAAVSQLLDAETPDGAVLQFGEPGKWGKRLERFLAHFGASLEERA